MNTLDDGHTLHTFVSPNVGQWYWLTDTDGSRDLWCVTCLGSNYVGFSRSGYAEYRVHFDAFASSCVYEPNASTIILMQILYRLPDVEQNDYTPRNRIEAKVFAKRGEDGVKALRRRQEFERKHAFVKPHTTKRS